MGFTVEPYTSLSGANVKKLELLLYARARVCVWVGVRAREREGVSFSRFPTKSRDLSHMTVLMYVQFISS